MAAPAWDLGVLPKVHPTVVHMLAEAAEKSPSATALVLGEDRLTYAQYRDRVAQFAQELLGLGARGQRVALICANSLDIPIAMFAVHAAGAQAVPINPAYTARELGHILADAAPIACVYDFDVAALVEPLLAEYKIRHGFKVGGTSGRRLWQSSDTTSRRLPEPLPAPTDLATLQYTGGTTGLPKGVNISHYQMAVNISQREAVLPTRPDDESVLCMMPLFHVFAVSVCLHLSVYCRGRLVIMPRYKPDWVLELIQKERITRLPAGPTIFIGLLNYETFDKTDFSSLRCSYSGSAPLPEDTLREWEKRVGSPILEGFGQTEAGPVLTYIRDGGPYKPGSVGPVLPLTELQIVDVETGTKVLGQGELGEIRARGPQIMSGYRNRPKETAEALRDGWLYTGDIGEFDADGYFYIRDRKKDMAIVGGYNVYPREIDEVLFAHPAVKEAASAGVPDSYYGEAIRAYVVLKEGAKATVDELMAHCKTNLTRYKVPSKLYLVKELPRTTVGKIDRKELRVLLAKQE
ncbi:MAG: long-chain fatty acid--CoA ligase [Rhodospirillales bacterium]|nr:long-chain fatty acid--CoA ligase [Rhodospirillales bacterium]